MWSKGYGGYARIRGGGGAGGPYHPGKSQVIWVDLDQVSLAAVNQICVAHEAMNGCKKSKDSLKAYFENVNICR